MQKLYKMTANQQKFYKMTVYQEKTLIKWLYSQNSCKADAWLPYHWLRRCKVRMGYEEWVNTAERLEKVAIDGTCTESGRHWQPFCNVNSLFWTHSS